jgi:hypothetical protein
LPTAQSSTIEPLRSPLVAGRLTPIGRLSSAAAACFWPPRGRPICVLASAWVALRQMPHYRAPDMPRTVVSKKPAVERLLVEGVEGARAASLRYTNDDVVASAVAGEARAFNILIQPGASSAILKRLREPVRL